LKPTQVIGFGFDFRLLCCRPLLISKVPFLRAHHLSHAAAHARATLQGGHPMPAQKKKFSRIATPIERIR